MCMCFERRRTTHALRHPLDVTPLACGNAHSCSAALVRPVRVAGLQQRAVRKAGSAYHVHHLHAVAAVLEASRVHAVTHFSQSTCSHAFSLQARLLPRPAWHPGRAGAAPSRRSSARWVAACKPGTCSHNHIPPGWSLPSSAKTKMFAIPRHDPHSCNRTAAAQHRLPRKHCINHFHSGSHF